MDQNQWYGNPEHQTTPTIELVSTEQTKKLISPAHKFMFLMIKPQHYRNITSNSHLSSDHKHQKQQTTSRYNT